MSLRYSLLSEFDEQIERCDVAYSIGGGAERSHSPASLLRDDDVNWPVLLEELREALVVVVTVRISDWC